MDRVCFARLVDRAARRDECLCEHLPAKDAPRTEVPVEAAVDVDLEGFEFEEGEEVGDGGQRGQLGYAAGSIAAVAGEGTPAHQRSTVTVPY